MTGKKVLAPRGIKVLYQVASSSRDHMTCSFSVNARGDIAPPRCVFQGVRNVAASHLKGPKLAGNSQDYLCPVIELKLHMRKVHLTDKFSRAELARRRINCLQSALSAASTPMLMRR